MRRKILIASVAIWAFVEVASKCLIAALASGLAEDNELVVLFDTAMMPPLPQYIVAAASLAVCVTCLSIEIAQRFPQSIIVKGLVNTGKLALTLYVFHVIIGMGAMESLGFLDSQSIEMAVLCAFTFCIFGMVFSIVWLKFFRIGPLEWVFRRISD